MVKITVHTGEPSEKMHGKMQDLGLCYVSRFTLDDGSVINSIVPKDSSVQQRLENDNTVLESFGYYGLVVLA